MHVFGNSSNRTFMELKWVTIWVILRVTIVLIVPLWNWNANKVADGAYQIISSNRTFMELK